MVQANRATNAYGCPFAEIVSWKDDALCSAESSFRALEARVLNSDRVAGVPPAPGYFTTGTVPLLTAMCVRAGLTTY
jgi:hypothetical protein